jgi:hypothetical protein
MTNWEKYGLEEKIRKILAEVSPSFPGHHLGRPFLTAYQIAIKLDEAHPHIARELGYEVGGKGTGRHVSLAQYVGGQLSQRIAPDHHDRIADIEGAFLSRHSVKEMVFTGGVVSSAEGRQDLSMYRLKVNP